jgi:hypothetical protein
MSISTNDLKNGMALDLPGQAQPVGAVSVRQREGVRDRAPEGAAA